MDAGNFSDLGQILYAMKENPQLMQMLMSMMGGGGEKAKQPDPFSMLAGMSKGAPQSSSGGNFGASEGGILGSSEDIKNRINLLNAVRPYLSEARRQRLDTVIKLMRLSELGTLSSMMKDM